MTTQATPNAKAIDWLGNNVYSENGLTVRVGLTTEYTEDSLEIRIWGYISAAFAYESEIVPITTITSVV